MPWKLEGNLRGPAGGGSRLLGLSDCFEMAEGVVDPSTQQGIDANRVLVYDGLVAVQGQQIFITGDVPVSAPLLSPREGFAFSADLVVPCLLLELDGGDGSWGKPPAFAYLSAERGKAGGAMYADHQLKRDSILVILPFAYRPA